MIVAAHIARKLVQGRATQIRVPANTRHCPFTVGRDYAVQPHHVDTFVTEETGHESELRQIARSIGRVQVIDIRRTTLDDLTLADARREGFTTRDEHAETWRLHRGSASGHLPVWVLSVRPHADAIRLLAPSGSQSRPVVGEHHQDRFSGEEHDYTSNPQSAMDVRFEPEAVDAATAAEFARRAAADREGRRAADERHQAGREAQTSAFVDELLKTNEGRKKLWDLRRRISDGLNKKDAA